MQKFPGGEHADIIPQLLSSAFVIFLFSSAALPLTVSRMLAAFCRPTLHHWQLAKSLSLLVLGIALATLATLNFSLAFLVGLAASPLTFIQPAGSHVSKICSVALLGALAPPVIVVGAAFFSDIALVDILKEASFGWNVSAMYTPVVVWCIWWPAWLVGMMSVVGDVV